MENKAGDILISSEIKYDELVQQNEAGILLLENDIVKYSNPAFEAILGATGAKIKGTSIISWVAGDDRHILKEGLDKMLNKEKEKFSADLLMKTEGEEVCYFSLHLKVLSRKEGSVEIIGASRNATSRMLKKIELNQTTSMFEALYHNIVEGIVIYNYAQEKIIESNEKAQKILGYKTDKEFSKITRFEFVPKTSKYFPGIDCHELTKNHGKRVMAGEAFKTPGVFCKQNGEHIIVKANVVPTFRNHGEAFIIFHDVTEKAVARKAQKALEERYRQIFDNAHEGIVYLDIKTKEPILCNDNTLKLLGLSSFEEFKTYLKEDFFLEDSDTGNFNRSYIEGKLKKTLMEGRVELNHWVKKKGGEVVRISCVLISDQSDSKNPKVISFLRDVTHLYKTQKALNEKNIELKKYIDSNLQLENFAYFASHDLQTPLRSIISFTQLLQKKLDGRLAESEKEYMDFVISASKNMRGLVNDLLSYSRVNTTKINLSDVNINYLLEELQSELASIIQEKKAEIVLRNIPEKVYADSMKLKQVFQNLITNALKFTKKGVASKIRITCKEQATQWLFSVKDNGIGIAPEFQDKIFLLFKRLHGNTDYEGTGIGLAMVKKIIEQHNGEIWLDSEEGEGATFWFTIKK